MGRVVPLTAVLNAGISSVCCCLDSKKATEAFATA